MSWLFDANHLERWADDRSAQDFLPRLVRQLIHGLTDDLSRIDFPAGSSVQLGGWDGIVESLRGNEFVLPGVSGWELSTQRGKKAKADGDYKKRSENPGILKPADSGFVLVTARRWAGKRDWEAARRKEGVWKDVRALDAEDLAAWLERTPPVGAWFAKELALPIESVQALADFWTSFKEATEPPLSAELLLAGREDQGKALSQWLESESGVYRIQAESEEEAVGFLAAVIEKLADEQKEHWLSRAIVLDKPEAWRGLGGRRNGLLVVLRGPYEQGASEIHRDGNHVLLASASRSRLGRADQSLALKRIPHEAFNDALKEMGLVDHEARKLAHETGRSVVVLRRHLMPVPPDPPWARAENASDLLPALLAGSWDEKQQGDREILAVLADRSYEDFARRLGTLAKGPEPPIRRVDTVWSLTAPMDAFLALGDHLRTSDLDRFEEAVTTVLLETDPALDLPVENRWAPNWFGKQRRYSGWLRRGLAETTVLLPIVDARVKLNVGLQVAGRIHGLVRALLEGVDGPRWYSLRSSLPTLAEAAPEAFLDAVEASLREDEPAVMTLFTENQYGFGGANQSDLLWALEKVAWSPDYLTRVAVILAQLTELDPGGNFTNRPATSLRMVFSARYRNTSATFDQRLEAIDRLLQQKPRIAAELLLVLLRETGLSSPSARPRWRDWDSGATEVILKRDYFKFIAATQARVLGLLTKLPLLWPQVINMLCSFDAEGRERIRQSLDSLDGKDVTADERAHIVTALRKLVAKHRQYPKKQWALPPHELEELDAIRARLTPEDLGVRYGWLFENYWVDLPEPEDETSYEEKCQKGKEARDAAVRHIVDSKGIEELLNLAKQVNQPGLLGAAAARVLRENSVAEREILATTLGSENVPLQVVALGYVESRYRSEGGEEWAESEFSRARRENWSPAAVSDFFCGLRPARRIWDILEQHGEEVKAAYWRKVNVGGVDGSSLAAFIIERLLEVDRFDAALYTARFYFDEVSSDLLARLLEAAALQDMANEQNVPDEYTIQITIEALQTRGDLESERLARLELIYLDLLTHGGVGGLPATLSKLLSEDSKIFVDLVGWTQSEESSQEQRARARKAFMLLDFWKGLPGLTEDGTLDPRGLQTWVEEAMEGCAAIGRGNFGNLRIGEVLARASDGEDGIWPAEPVRDLLEQLQNPEVERGVCIGLLKQRGVVSRGPGGDQERELGSKYRGYAEAMLGHWPRTRRVLQMIADSYATEGRYWDRAEELDDLR